jgi:hypothetical protein
MPLEFIFGDPGYKVGEISEIDYMGVRVQVTKDSGRGTVINRIISTSPKAYLNPKLQPGNIIDE